MRGKKECPKCNHFNGLRQQVCTQCGEKFVPKEKVKKEKKPKAVKPEKELSKEIRELLLVEYKPPPILTPKKHAKRILGYGKDRAKALLFTAQKENRWKHVDWGKVEQGVA